MYLKFFLSNLNSLYGLSLKELSKKSKLNFTTLEGYEFKNIQPPYQNIIKLSSFFNLSIDYLTRGEQSRFIKNILFLKFANEVDDLPYSEVNKLEIYIDAFLDRRKSIHRIYDKADLQFTKNFNDNFRAIVEYSELTENDFAKKFDLTKRKVASYKKATECPYEILCKISDKYKISMHWIITGEKLNFNFEDRKFEKQVLKADEYLEKKYIDNTIELAEKILKSNNVDLEKVMST